MIFIFDCVTVQTENRMKDDRMVKDSKNVRQVIKKTVNFEEQIMFKDKYPSIFFSPNGSYCVYYSSNLFRNARSFEIWGIYKQ